MKMSRKQYYALLLTPTIIVASLMAWGLLTPSTAIVEGRVLAIAPYQGHYLAQIDARQAFPTTFFEAFADCNLPMGSSVFIAVSISGMAFGHQPISQDVDLYQVQGIGFVPWNGC
jgi:hypothetical protein